MLEESKQQIIKNLISDLKKKNVSSRKQAVFKLGEMKAKDSVPHLLKLLKKEKDDVIRRNTTRALGKIGDKSAVNALCELLFDNDYYVKQNAAWSLGKLKDKRAVDPLLRLIKGGAGKIYTESGSQASVDNKDSGNELLKTEGMKYHDVQIKAIKALGEIKDEKAIEILSDELDEEEEGNVRCAIVLTLGKIGSKDAVPKLIEMLGDTIWYVRRDTAKALGLLGDLRAVDILVEKLEDKYLEVVEAAVNTLKKLGNLAISKAFILNPKNDSVKEMVKTNFKSKQDLLDSIKEIIELEDNPQKKEEYQKLISSLAGK
jgi:HEAT repeat protein